MEKDIFKYQVLDYSEDQQKMLTVIKDRLDKKTNKEIDSEELRISGFAGTGKTTMVINILKYAKDYCKFSAIVVLAPTNKAKNVLQQKFKGQFSNNAFSTLHQFLYGSPDKEKEKEQDTNLLSWSLKQEVREALVIIDESSMLTTSVYNDIKACFKKSVIIFLGDGYQLEPVISGKDSDAKLLQNPNITLTQVRRNAGDILDYSVAIRTINKVISPSPVTYPSISYQTYDEAYRDYLLSISNKEDSILITATNKARVIVNSNARIHLYGMEYKSYPLKGDKLISICNCENFSNGDTLETESFVLITELNIRFEGKYKTEVEHVIFGKLNDLPTIILPTTENASVYHFKFSTLDYDLLHSIVGTEYIEFDESGRYHKLSKAVSIVTYGYAISAHKSQGSQWDKVFVYQNWISNNKAWNDARWLYTAITRAINKLHLIK